MIESAIVLTKVAIVCGAGFLVATGFEWFSDMEVKPRNKTITVGEEKKRGGGNHDSKIEHLHKAARERG